MEAEGQLFKPADVPMNDGHEVIRSLSLMNSHVSPKEQGLIPFHKDLPQAHLSGFNELTYDTNLKFASPNGLSKVRLNYNSLLNDKNPNDCTIPCSDHHTNNSKESPQSDYEFEKPIESLEQATGNDLFIKPKELNKSVYVVASKINDEEQCNFSSNNKVE